ncbi:hypothetical protein DFQ27_001147 [Actinomortierella ambigua]|uniref:Uncharacterized protein n=1 Tax=Actinomortierella ambigua TaxID=1343610 RepID=A0A9P6QEL5_9FUNG|nr:hypothetical protein DFQ27_001147 [Actinomortierella ambigua]
MFMMGRQYYGAVWSQYLQKAVYYGGQWPDGIENLNVELMVTYDPKTKEWKEEVTTGLGMWVMGHCIAISIEIGLPSTPVAIYQISSNSWVQEFKPLSKYVPPAPPSPSTSATSSGSTAPPSQSPSGSPVKPESGEKETTGTTTNIGAIAGGIGGAVVVVVIIAFFVWKRAKQGTKHLDQQHNPSPEVGHHDRTADSRDHQTKQTPQTPSQMGTSRSPQQPRDRGYKDEDDGRFIGMDGNLYASDPNITTSSHDPHYPSLIDDMDDSRFSHMASKPYGKSNKENKPSIETGASLSRRANVVASSHTAPSFPASTCSIQVTAISQSTYIRS